MKDLKAKDMEPGKEDRIWPTFGEKNGGATIFYVCGFYCLSNSNSHLIWKLVGSPSVF